MSWKIKKLKKNIEFKNAVLIEGLPGIGNVGKLVVDFLIDELHAKSIYELSSFDMPNMVFVNENHLVEMPKIKIYLKKTKGRKPDILLLGGDTQPTENAASHEFASFVVDFAKKQGIKEIITLGGIGLNKEVKNPKVYCTSHSKKVMDKYKELKIKTKIHGVVGPIFGASGLIVGFAGEKGIDAAVLLAETYNHPLNLGVKGAKAILKKLDKKLGLNLDIKRLNSESRKIEKQLKENLEDIQGTTKEKTDTTYIG
ncbi:MAG: PAC2 family protein [Nanoarchaeota archaeon]|nr:PAC2 family protein [Nanoarchaeota archaeon]